MNCRCGAPPPLPDRHPGDQEFCSSRADRGPRSRVRRAIQNERLRPEKDCHKHRNLDIRQHFRPETGFTSYHCLIKTDRRDWSLPRQQGNLPVRHNRTRRCTFQPRLRYSLLRRGVEIGGTRRTLPTGMFTRRRLEDRTGHGCPWRHDLATRPISYITCQIRAAQTAFHHPFSQLLARTLRWLSLFVSPHRKGQSWPNVLLKPVPSCFTFPPEISYKGELA